jgi:hypothetical protein
VALSCTWNLANAVRKVEFKPLQLKDNNARFMRILPLSAYRT